MTSQQTDPSAPTTKGVVWRSIGECTGWAALLGAIYLPGGVLVFIGLSMRIDSGSWDTIDDPGIFVSVLALLGLIVGVALGVVSGIVVGLMVSSSVRSAATERRLRLIGALSAAATVALMAGMISLWFLAAPDDAMVWDLMVRPVWVLFSWVVPTAIAAVVLYWRTPRIVASAAR